MLVPRYSSPALLGSRIARGKDFGFQHPGTCVTRDCSVVVDGFPGIGVRLVPFPVYSDGEPVEVQSYGLDLQDAVARATRALSLVERTPYDLLTANCEHVANYAEA